jgi:hypothetical protein
MAPLHYLDQLPCYVVSGLAPTAHLQRPQIAQHWREVRVPYLERESIGLPPFGVVATNDDDIRATPQRAAF